MARISSAAISDGQVTKETTLLTQQGLLTTTGTRIHWTNWSKS